MSGRRLTNDRDLRDLLDRAAELGCSVSKRANGHLRIDTPSGPVFCSCSPSDHRAVHRIRQDLRHKGVTL